MSSSERHDSILDSLSIEAPRVRLQGSDDAPALRRSGRFEILGPIAEGGVGEVMKGRDIDLGREVAIKVLREHHTGNADLVQRFVEEAQIEGQLQHPGIVPVYELGIQSDDRPFFAMKLVKGDTLAARFKQRETVTDSRRELLAHFEQVCQTVAYAHARGVVHRDLKPSNVMIGAFGEVQVLDWGFAKVLARGGVADERPLPDTPDLTTIATVRSEAEGSQSIPGSVMGTPAYMPPEQAMGLVESLDTRSDVFSLGAILCELLTGQPPYRGNTRELLVQAAQADLDDAHARLDKCTANPALVALAKRCLEPKRSRRPRDASVVATSVADHLASVERRAHESALAAAESKANADRASAVATGQRKARRQTIALAATLLIALLGAGGVWAWIRNTEQQRLTGVASAVSAAIEEAQDARGRQAWSEASRAIDRALELDGDGLREGELNALLRIVSDEEWAAAEADAKQKRADAFLARLQEATLQNASRAEFHYGLDAFGALFASYGIDLDQDADPLLDQLRATGFPERLLFALDRMVDWSRRSGHDAQSEKLRTIVATLDQSTISARIRELEREGDYAQLVRLSESDEVRSADLWIIRRLSEVLRLGGELDAAIALLRATHVRLPGSLTTNFNLGWDLLRRATRDAQRDWGGGKHVYGESPALHEADRFAAAAMALAPNSPHALSLRGSIALSRGDIESAIVDLDRALDLSPDSRTILVNRGLAAIDTKDWKKAHELFETVRRAHPNWSVAVHRQGIAAFRQGDYPRATQLNLEAARLGYVPAYADAASAEQRLSNYDAALAHYRKAVMSVEGTTARDRETRAALYARWGKGLNAAGRGRESPACFLAALREQPDYHFARYLFIAAIRTTHLDFIRADRESRELVRRAPHLALAHEMRGSVLRMLEDFEGAERAYRKALELGIRFGSGITETNLAFVLAGQGRYRDAMDMVQKAAAHVHSPRGKAALAKTIEFVGVFLEWSEKGPPKTAPNDAIKFQLAKFHEQRGDLEIAATLIRQIEWAHAGMIDAVLHIKNGEHEMALADIRAFLEYLADKPEDSRRGTLGQIRLGRELAPLRDAKLLAKLPTAIQAQCRALWAEIDKDLEDVAVDYTGHAPIK